jgi:hypothetical protein
MRSIFTSIRSNYLRTYNPPALRSQRLIVQRTLSTCSPLSAEQAAVPKNEDDNVTKDTQQERGAMSRRLSEMAEECMDTGSKSDRKLMEDAGFSEELKRTLEERIAQTAFKAEHQQAFSEVNMPVGFFLLQ